MWLQVCKFQRVIDSFWRIFLVTRGLLLFLSCVFQFADATEGTSADELHAVHFLVLEATPILPVQCGISKCEMQTNRLLSFLFRLLLLMHLLVLLRYIAESSGTAEQHPKWILIIIITAGLFADFLLLPQKEIHPPTDHWHLVALAYTILFMSSSPRGQS